MTIGVLIALSIGGIIAVFIAASEDKKRKENLNEGDKNNKQIISPLIATVLTVSIIIIFAIIVFIKTLSR